MNKNCDMNAAREYIHDSQRGMLTPRAGNGNIFGGACVGLALLQIT